MKTDIEESRWKADMYNSPEELLKRIRVVEDTALESKEVRFKGSRIEEPDRNDLANDLAAMANTHDGVLVLGVDDKTKDVIGIPVDRLEAVERYVFEICNDSITPVLIFHSFYMPLPDLAGNMQHVLVIEVPRSLFVHRSPGGYYFRQGSSVRQMPPEYLARLFQQRSQARIIRFEEQPVPESNISDLPETLRTKYITRSEQPDEIVLLKRGLLAKDESGTVRPSVAGVLFCCEAPERFLPNAYIEAVRYRGTKQDSNYQIDATKIHGPLYQQIEQTMKFLIRNQKVSAVKKPHRIENRQFSERAVFEATVNAVAHRDYSIATSKIRFFMFDDRLEIYSPGALANTVTVDSLDLRQATRNELVTRLLAETPVAETPGSGERGFYMEKRGEGVPVIFDESERLSGKKPLYRLIDDSELLLVIYSAIPVEGQE